MAGIKISALPAVPSALLTDFLPVVQGGVTSKETLAQIATLFNANLTFLPLSGGTMTGAINMGGFQINNMADPALAQDAATKNYVDNIATGGGQPVVAASTTALTVTYVNGVAGVGATLTNAGTQVVFALDGQSPTVGQRVLIKNQSSTFQNGVYTVTNVGSIATNWILTRATDYDTPADINSTGVIPVTAGTVNANTGWINTTQMVTVGTTAVTFIQFGASYPISLANGGTNASLTASNGGIFYSTASAGAILAGTATAGLALLSGSNTTPTWSTSPPITQVNVQRVTATGAGTYTPTTGMKYVIVRAQAGGASGGGAATSVDVAAGGGGGGGEYIEALFTAANIGASKAFSVGAGGAASSAGNNNGNVGGNTTFNTTWIVATGGSAGSGSPDSGSTIAQFMGAQGAGGTGGSVATGTLLRQLPGSSGIRGLSTGGQGQGGTGGNSGSGGAGAFPAYAAAGNAAIGNSGGGGSGGTTQGQTQVTSGAGGSGFIEFVEYISV